MPSSPTPTNNISIGELLLAFRRKMNACTKKGSFERELTFSQMEILMFIGPSEKKSMESIAKYLKVAPPSATSLIEKMEKAGLVLRKKDKNDRRVVFIELSPKTKKMIAVLWKKKEKILDKIVSKLNPTDRSHFRRIMKILIND
ncbi:MAG: MarR family transcriptional regulator [Candidatus Pacebacteria bacterium]|nr:MarR family transcriptional regulator [Candidatus Paceibacterota bacterium]